MADCQGNAARMFAGPTFIWAFSCPLVWIFSYCSLDKWMFWKDKKSQSCASHTAAGQTRKAFQLFSPFHSFPRVMCVCMHVTSYISIPASILAMPRWYEWSSRLLLLVINNSLITACYLSHVVSFSECCNRNNTPLLPLHVFTPECHCCNSLSNFCIIAEDNVCVIEWATNKQILAIACLLGQGDFGQK